MGYIYKITNIINGKVYIGKTEFTIKRRFKQHCEDCKKERLNEVRPLYRAMKKYGVDNFISEEIEQCDNSILCDREKYWIQYYDSYKHGYNATIGGDGTPRIDQQQVISLYNQLKNQKAVAKQLKIDATTVRKILRSNNITIIGRSEIKRVLLGKKVAMIDKITGEVLKEFDTVSDAANYLKMPTTSRSNIGRVCNGKRKTAYGYKWKWI